MQTTKTTDGFRNEASRAMTLLRDEARVRLHLFSMDARQRWHVLETAAHELNQRARDFWNRQSNRILF